MNRRSLRHLGFALLFLCFCLGTLVAQEHAATPDASQAQSDAGTQQPPPNPDASASQDLVKESQAAEHAEEGKGHEENAEFKYSSMVAKLGHFIGLDAHGMYWVSIAVNFGILAIFFWLLLRKKLPGLFRDRTNSIHKALKEAQTASAEASRRLGDIEARLSKLDAEVSDIKAGAERDAATEEERVRAAAEEDKHKVVAAAESEIAAITRSARHELKSFAASLAVDLASKRIKVDDDADQSLVRQFVGHLGKDGQ